MNIHYSLKKVDKDLILFVNGSIVKVVKAKKSTVDSIAKIFAIKSKDAIVRFIANDLSKELNNEDGLDSTNSFELGHTNDEQPTAN